MAAFWAIISYGAIVKPHLSAYTYIRLYMMGSDGIKAKLFNNFTYKLFLTGCISTVIYALNTNTGLRNYMAMSAGATTSDVVFTLGFLALLVSAFYFSVLCIRHNNNAAVGVMWFIGTIVTYTLGIKVIDLALVHPLSWLDLSINRFTEVGHTLMAYGILHWVSTAFMVAAIAGSFIAPALMAWVGNTTKANAVVLAYVCLQFTDIIFNIHGLNHNLGETVSLVLTPSSYVINELMKFLW
ncbi:hypothetical protein [Vibrio profundi]|uniref:hypothetical protein n=1 Tax=Vibrio profundi TaxID=1774960 RepID=UPI003736EB7B